MGFKIFIDPGHGGEDNGAAFGEKYDFAEEDDLNLAIALLLRAELKEMGYSTAISREADEFVSLHDRAKDANAWHADCFVSVHCDAWHRVTTRGISVHIHPHCGDNARELGQCIRSALLKAFPEHADRGLVESNFQVLRATRMPAVLVECEFVTNPDTRKFLREPGNQLLLARAIAKGITSYAIRRV